MKYLEKHDPMSPPCGWIIESIHAIIPGLTLFKNLTYGGINMHNRKSLNRLAILLIGIAAFAVTAFYPSLLAASEMAVPEMERVIPAGKAWDREFILNDSVSRFWELINLPSINFSKKKPSWQEIHLPAFPALSIAGCNSCRSGTMESR